MSGHSKWATIKRKKGATDAKRGAMFTKLGKEIAIAAREGGPDPEMNFKLRLVMDKAKASNMPKDNIERAIRRGAGIEKSDALEEAMYEGYGPHGVAFLVQVVTDNRNRAVSDIRRQFNRMGGSLGEAGCVAWMFEQKGYLSIMPDGLSADDIFNVAVEYGAEDVVFGDESVEVYTAPEDLHTVREALAKRGAMIDSADLTMLPKTTMTLEDKQAFQNLNLIDGLEDLDDVSAVYTNLDMPDELVARYEDQA
jgi:YebC/PmpR family DNA-binding regulatory protein